MAAPRVASKCWCQQVSWRDVTRWCRQPDSCVRGSQSQPRHGAEMMSLGMWLLLLLLLLPHVSVAQESPFILPTETSHNVEFYDIDDYIRIAIFLNKVSYHEAQKLCAGKRGHLLELNEEDLPEFIARALAESAVSFGTLWVGGEFTPSTSEGGEGEWRWAKSGTPIRAKLGDVTGFPMNETPFWVAPPDLASRKERCLATDRKMHYLPLIVDLPCDKERPFICSLPSPNKDEGPYEIKPPMRVGNSEFHLFFGQYTWDQSLAYCRSLGLKLAKLTTETEFRTVENRMKRARPIVENAWIGGEFSNGQWMWLSSDEPIALTNSSEPEGEKSPWYRPDNIVMEGCLLADRHLCDRFVYVEAKCDRRRNFICQKDLKSAEQPPLKQVDESAYWVSTYPDTWLRAQNACAEYTGGELIQLSATKQAMDTQLPVIFTAMALTLREELRHVWIGGYLFNEVFKWTHDPSDEPKEAGKIIDSKEFEAVADNGEKGSLTFESVDFKEESYLKTFKCMDLDRENQMNFFMYGLTCELKQYFICQSKDGNGRNPGRPKEPGTQGKSSVPTMITFTYEGSTTTRGMSKPLG